MKVLGSGRLTTVAISFALLCLLFFAAGANGAAPGPVAAEEDDPGAVPWARTMTIEVVNITTYLGDTLYDDLVTDPGVTIGIPKTFVPLWGIGDIVAVDGQPAKGTWTVFTPLVVMAPFQAPGVAIADIERAGIATSVHEIQDADGNASGTIMAVGLAGGPPPPFAPADHLFGNLTIVGGTGRYFGIKGFGGETSNPLFGFRFASTSEDPSNRRVHGGGTLTFIFTVLMPASTELKALEELLRREAVESRTPQRE